VDPRKNIENLARPIAQGVHALGEGQKPESASGGLRSRPINYPGASRSATARDRVINDQHNDCSDNGHDNAADINTGYAGAT
jgi:hypothetical protein